MVRAAIPFMAMLCATLAQAASTPAPQAPPRPALAGTHPPIAKAGDEGCVGCHKDKQQHKVVHGPVAVGACSSCHVVNESGGRTSVGLIGGPSPDRLTGLCVGCHEDIAGKLKQAHVHAPVAAGACTTCHDPHGSGFPFMLPAAGPANCLACHEDIAEALGKGFAHAPAAEACVVCHDPHASRNDAQTREPLNNLCVACHYDQPDPAPDDPELLLGRPAPVLERAMVKEGRRIHLDKNMFEGHPIARHPVTGKPNPAENGKPLTCASCHNPHGAVSRALFRFGARGSSDVCLACHKF